MLPMLDSLAHATVTGRWLGGQRDASFSALARGLEESGFIGACAIGLAGIEGYAHESFMRECNKYRMLIPVAGFDPHTPNSTEAEMDHIVGLGYRGIKIHPRYSSLNFSSNNLAEIFRLAASRNLIVFYCTYAHDVIEKYPDVDPFYSLISVLRNAPEAKVVLVHGGDVQLLRYAELVRFNRNLLLDLSLTMMKYGGSSIDLDVRFLFGSFDERICIGTDYPEFTHAALRSRFEELSKGISNRKRENIGYRNLAAFLNVERQLAAR